MITTDTRVRLDKLSQQREGLLPNGYWLVGKMIEEPLVGRTLRVARTSRAKQSPEETEPVVCFGLYVSSPVQSIDQHEDESVTCVTLNSTWKIMSIDA